jgi:hypothetical protein
MSGGHGGRVGQHDEGRGSRSGAGERSPGGRPRGALERAPQAGGGPAAAAGRGPRRAGRARPGQAAGTISAWREDFLVGGQEGLKSRPAPVEDRRLADARRKIGELAMDNDILRALLEEVEHRPRRPRR